METVILLDTSAFIVGYEVADVNVKHYTVPLVGEELTRDDMLTLRFETALQTGKLTVLSPQAQYIDEVKVASAELGETGALSPTDVELLGLALQLKSEGKSPILVSDDYSVQNVADRLGLRYRSLATAGIKRRFDWMIYCPGCHRAFDKPQPGGVCPVCGTPLKRRPVGKRPAEGRMGSSGILGS